MKNLFPLLIAFLLLFSCKQLPESHLEQQALLPIVKNVLPTGKHFNLNRPLTLSYDEKDSLLYPLTVVLKEGWEKTTGNKFSEKWAMQRIEFKRTEGLAQEEYILSIDQRTILLEATTNEGFFRAIKTLEQLLLLGANQDKSTTPFTLPTGIIKDRPRFAYRGTMLDVSRHFFRSKTLSATSISSLFIKLIFCTFIYPMIRVGELK